MTKPEPLFETHHFTVGATSHIFIVEPTPNPAQYGGGTRYSVAHHSVRVKSVQQPLIVWGAKMQPEIPLAWADALGRCKTWKTGLSRLFLGSNLSVRIGIFEGADYRTGMPKTVRMLQAVHVHDEKPTKEALEWLQTQIDERKRWFATE